MNEQTILEPFLAMMVLTFAVWVYLYIRRIGYIVAHRIHPQKLATTEKGLALIPEQVNLPAYNFRNLFEMPVLFYALCLYLYATASVDQSYVVAAWFFVAVRALHSLLQCTLNIVRLRFALYMLSSFALWWMMFRAVLQLIAA